MNPDNSVRSGWRRDEENLLFAEAERGRGEGVPLRTVFDRVAGMTGRRPNSIRNYYYARVKEKGKAEGGACGTAFVPFTETEMRSLLKAVLAEQAKGVSVRACTLKLGSGDNKAMLRYQNKYRSLIRNNPALVREVMAEMQADGVKAFDPYAKGAPSSGRGRRSGSGRNIVEVVSGVVNDLGMVEGLDVQAFFEALGALAVGAGRGSAAVKELAALKKGEGSDALELRERCEELTEQLRMEESELSAQRERFKRLLMLFRQLMSVNRGFLGMTGVSKMSSLPDYVHELSRSVEDCERLMTEYVN